METYTWIDWYSDFREYLIPVSLIFLGISIWRKFKHLRYGFTMVTSIVTLLFGSTIFLPSAKIIPLSGNITSITLLVGFFIDLTRQAIGKQKISVIALGLILLGGQLFNFYQSWNRSFFQLSLTDSEITTRFRSDRQLIPRYALRIVEFGSEQKTWHFKGNGKVIVFRPGGYKTADGNELSSAQMIDRIETWMGRSREHRPESALVTSQP